MSVRILHTTWDENNVTFSYNSIGMSCSSPPHSLSCTNLCIEGNICKGGVNAGCVRITIFPCVRIACLMLKLTDMKRSNDKSIPALLRTRKMSIFSSVKA